MHIGPVDHINIVVADLARSVRFYRDILGFRETRRARLSGAWIEAIVGLPDVRAEVVYLQASGAGPRLELLHYEQPAGSHPAANREANTIGLRHIALRVDDMGAAVARLRAHGVEPLSEPVAVPSSVVTHDAGHKRLCYFHDPDGVLLELAAYESAASN